MSTVMTPTRTEEECDDPNVVKIVVGGSGDALYFSRRRIPDGANPASAASTDSAFRAIVMRHIGLYAYRRDFLDVFTRLGPTPLEQSERLEQLRALEHGHRIGVALWEGAPMLEVNTPEELEAARRQAAGPGPGEAERRGTSGPLPAADERRNATKPIVSGAAARGAR
jgi:3-deoxy-manno-octulosonate cytidylyltransferase (CMP-KDO synthetase)